MATLNYWFGSWVSTEGVSDLNAGASHYWLMWGFQYGDAISVTAHPVVLQNEERLLRVSDIKVEGNGTGRRLYFTVTNVGNSSIPGYGMGFSMISQ